MYTYIYTSTASVSPTTHSHICMRIHSHSLAMLIFSLFSSQPLLLFLLMIFLLNALGFQNYFVFGCNAQPEHVFVCLPVAGNVFDPNDF